MRYLTPYGCALLGWLALSVGWAAPWRTADGLSVTLSDRTGEITAVTVGGQALRLADGGGLSLREFTRDPSAPARTVLQLGAEGDEQTWTAASFADWDVKDDVVRRATGAAPEGEAYLQLGDGQNAGVGLAVAQAIPVDPGGEALISWQARTADPELTYILCLRLFDSAGRDITESSPAPPGWGWSPYSRAHYRCDLSNTKPATWERLTAAFQVPEGAVAARLSLRVYTKGTLRADVDDLQVAVKAGHWSAATPVRGRLQQTAAGLVQTTELRSHGLAFETRYSQEAGQLRATVEVTARGPQPRGRCLQLRYRLPLALAGWQWAADPGEAQVIPAAGKCEAAFGLAGHSLSRYPLASVSRGAVGLAMAVPLDQPALQTFAAAADGLTTTVDLGLSPLAPRARARFSFTLYRHDPTWSFRAALERYYALFPALFAPATNRGGAWTLRLPKPEVATPEEFGLAFYECNLLTPEQQAACRAHGVLTFPYAEPWGRRQHLGDAKSSADLPPYEERLAFLKSLAAQPVEGKKWGEAPRDVMAQAVLNSLVLGPDGVAVYLVDFYSSWSQWWQLNTDPDLPAPSIASACRQYEIDPLLPWADGIYLDSVSPYFCQWEDHAPAHLAAADLPLAFSLRSGQPVVLSGFAHYEFVHRLRDDLHARRKVLMMNLFPPATRLFGHFGDVVGSELLGLQDDAEAMQQRVYAYRRPVSNLMQWRSAVQQRVPAMTPEEMESYLANQLLYGFWPGISTAGGGTKPGYANMHRYFEDPELLARDRPLFRRYLPLFDALNAAGWEPVTHVRADVPGVRVERYGRGREVRLAVANAGAEARQAKLIFDREWWAAATGRAGAFRLHSELTGETLRADRQGATLSCAVTVPPRRTLVLRLAGE